ncbi:hypothetical protein ACWCP6_31555 [Streptomyces sp. NPDC002004]
MFAWNQVKALRVQRIALPEWRMVKDSTAVCLKFVDGCLTETGPALPFSGCRF